jgi:hypothetical protein
MRNLTLLVVNDPLFLLFGLVWIISVYSKVQKQLLMCMFSACSP